MLYLNILYRNTLYQLPYKEKKNGEFKVKNHMLANQTQLKTENSSN